MTQKTVISSLTSTQLREMKAKDLDAKWHEKYPEGMYYAIQAQNLAKVAMWRCGQLKARPTSRSSINAPYSGGYCSSSFYNVVKHKTFKTIEPLFAFAEENKFTKDPFILYNKTGFALTGEKYDDGKEVQYMDVVGRDGVTGIVQYAPWVDDYYISTQNDVGIWNFEGFTLIRRDYPGPGTRRVLEEKWKEREKEI